MKILVDSLPYDRNSCPFNFSDSWGYSLCPCRMDEEKYPIYIGILIKFFLTIILVNARAIY